MHDFFERQDQARRLSVRLVVILALTGLGTVLVTAAALAGLVVLLAIAQVSLTTNIVMDTEYWLGVLRSSCWLTLTVASVIVIGVGIFKTYQFLEGGGVALAKQLGATRLWSDAEELKYRQLLNVVEEMAVVTGLPVPKVFLLEGESCINAFAAGIQSKDTVVGVTQGALDMLSREQLQAVVAHEFSHILNRDVQISLQTLGALQGIEAITSAARYLIRLGAMSNLNGSPLAAIFGYVLWPIGKIGAIFGLLAKMALNRQREFLADAAAVQFTRNPMALSAALKLIGSHARGGLVESGTAQLASHLFFAEAGSRFMNLLRSHPTLAERIRRIEPNWDGTFPEIAAAANAPSAARNDELAVPV